MRNIFSRTGIRGRLLLLVLALCLPFLAYVLISAAGQAKGEREFAKERNLVLARLIAARVDDYLGDINQLLSVLGRTVDTTQEATTRNDLLLRRLSPQLPERLDNIAVWNLAGDNVGSLAPSLRLRPFNVADRGYFRTAIQSSNLTTEAPLLARSNQQWKAVFARPVLRVETVVGVVAATVELGQLQAHLQPKDSLPVGAVVTIFNQDGVVLSRSQDAQAWIGKDLSKIGTIGASLRQREGMREESGSDGAARLTGYATAREVPWLVYVEVPTEMALGPIREQLYKNLGLGAAMLLVGLFLAALVGESITRPLRHLTMDAEAFGAGNLAHRSRVASGGEVAVLAQTLNDMAVGLQDRQLALQASEKRLRLVTDNMPALIAYVDRHERYRFVNAFYGDVLDADPEAMIGQTVRACRGDSCYAAIKPHIDEALGGMPVCYDFTYEVKGQARDLTITYFPDYDDAHDVPGFFVMGLDVTQKRRTERALQASEATLRAIADNLPILIAVIDRDERYCFCNATYLDWYGLEPAAILGRTIEEVIGPAGYAADGPYVKRALAGETVTFERTGDLGRVTRHVLKTYLPRRNAQSGETDGFYAMVQDLSARKALEDQLSRMAQYDQLTGLPNRYLLDDRLKQACARSTRSGEALALLYLDMDGFKPVNDALGHAAGDEVLRQFARRLVATVRSSDTVARLGGDEFVVVMEGVSWTGELERVAQKINEAMHEPFQVSGHSVLVSTSIGIATFPSAGSSQDLLHAADAAMYRAKETGGARFVMAAVEGDAEPTAAST